MTSRQAALTGISIALKQSEPSTFGGGTGAVRPILGVILMFGLFIFFPGKENDPKETALSRVSCASPNRLMKRRLMPPCGVTTLVRVLTI